jgi:hypothetical protein
MKGCCSVHQLVAQKDFLMDDLTADWTVALMAGWMDSRTVGSRAGLRADPLAD